MTVVRCPHTECKHKEEKGAICCRDNVFLDWHSSEDGELVCKSMEIPSEEKMEVPTKDLTIYSLAELSAERGWIMKALDDDIWSDDDHWWRSQMYARLAAIELLIHSYDNWE